MRGKVGADEALAAALTCVRDFLRSGGSLRQGILTAGAAEGSPLGPLAAELGSHSALPDALEEAARRDPAPELSFALAGLAMHARAGGNPVPLVEDLVGRLRERSRAARELRAVTSQARLQARAITWLTPGFLSLLLILDPRGMASSLATPSGALVVAAGLLLQVLGGLWIRRIVSAPLGRPSRRYVFDRLASVPVVRACLTPCIRTRERRRRFARREEVARAAELMALAFAAGLGAAHGLEAVARSLTGQVGEALRDAARALRAGAARADALRDAAVRIGLDEARTLAQTLETGHALGVPVASSLRALAAETRHALNTEIAEEMRRASLKVLLPLALMILPAFVLACLVPLFLNGLRGMPL